MRGIVMMSSLMVKGKRPISLPAGLALRALGWAGAAGILALAAAAVLGAREEALTAAQANLRRVDIVLAESVERLVQTADLELAGLAEDLGAAGLPLAADGQALHRRLWQTQAGTPIAFRITVFDADGRQVGSSWPEAPLSAPLVSDRSYFTGHRIRPDAGLLVSEPVRSRLDGHWSFLLTRRISGPDGSFQGVVVAAMDLDHLDRLFAAALPEDGARVSLLRDDRLVLFRHPDDAGLSGRSQLHSLAEEAFLGQGRGGGDGRLAAEGEAPAVVMAARRLSRYPLAVSVAVPEQTLLATWRRMALDIGGAGLAVAGGWLVLLVLLDRQIARRRASERALASVNGVLAEERGRLWRVLDAASDGFWEWHLTSGLVDWSERCCALMGLPAAGGVLHIEQVVSLVHPDDRERYWSAIRRHIETDEPFQIEARWQGLGGGVRWMATRGHVVRDQDGQPMSLVGAHTDITARKALEDR